MIKIKGRAYDDTAIQEFGPKLGREFLVAAIKAKCKIDDSCEADSLSPFQKAVNAMTEMGLLDLKRLNTDVKYAKVILSVFLSRLLTPDAVNASNDAAGFIWPLDVYEIEAPATTKSKKIALA